MGEHFILLSETALPEPARTKLCTSLVFLTDHQRVAIPFADALSTDVSNIYIDSSRSEVREGGRIWLNSGLHSREMPTLPCSHVRLSHVSAA